MEIFTSYHNVLSPLGFTTKENYTAILSNTLGVKQCHYGKLNELFCLSIIPDKEIISASEKINSPSSFTKLEKLSILSIQDVLNQSGISLSDKKTLLIYSKFYV